MKILKDGTIEACCEWIEEVNESSCLQLDTRDAAGEIRPPVLRVLAFGWWTMIISHLQFDFCPNCGAKTEVVP